MSPPGPETPAPSVLVQQVASDVVQQKSLVPPSGDTVSHSKSPAAVAKVPVTEKSSKSSIDRDAVLAKIEMEKRMALIKAWEECEKTKAENKAYKKLFAIEAWENSQKASVEAQLKKIEEKLEKKKAEYAEIMKNKIAEIHKAAEEKKAKIEAKRHKDILKVEEMAAKFRATGQLPMKFLACFSS